MRLHLFSGVLLSVSISISVFGEVGADLKICERDESVRYCASCPFYWRMMPVSGGGQIITLFARVARPAAETLPPATAGGPGHSDVPLVAVLRDTLRNQERSTDRLRYVWLLTSAQPTLKQRLLSAVPFFYWRVNHIGRSPERAKLSPLIDISAPRRAVWDRVGKDILQRIGFDPMATPIRASTREYRTNMLNYRRLHLEEASSLLRQAPVCADGTSLTREELRTVIGRLVLAKRRLGGLAGDQNVARVVSDGERKLDATRGRNWELLRVSAEKAGLIFEPLQVGGTSGEYAMLWFPLYSHFSSPGVPLKFTWKLLGITDPWKDQRLAKWQSFTRTHLLDGSGPAEATRQATFRRRQLAPLAVFSLNYPKAPLLMIDFRRRTAARRRELMQRSLEDVTSGILGLSHFGNWYYYAGTALYSFVRSRHGAGVNQASRLDCYSEFRMALALDEDLDPVLRKQLQQRIGEQAINPLESGPQREIESAIYGYRQLIAAATNEKQFAARLERDRRAEIVAFEASRRRHVADQVLRVATLGAYMQRAGPSPDNIVVLGRIRRIQHDLRFLSQVANSGMLPEVTHDALQIRGVMEDLKAQLKQQQHTRLRRRAGNLIARVGVLSQDDALRAECFRLSTSLKATLPDPSYRPSPKGQLSMVNEQH